MQHYGLGSIRIRTGPAPCTGHSDARQVPARTYSYRLGFYLNGAARLFTVPGLSYADLTYPSGSVFVWQQILREVQYQNTNFAVLEILSLTLIINH